MQLSGCRQRLLSTPTIAVATTQVAIISTMHVTPASQDCTERHAHAYTKLQQAAAYATLTSVLSLMFQSLTGLLLW